MHHSHGRRRLKRQRLPLVRGMKTVGLEPRTVEARFNKKGRKKKVASKTKLCQKQSFVSRVE
jgi:hypothetical protein